MIPIFIVREITNYDDWSYLFKTASVRKIFQSKFMSLMLNIFCWQSPFLSPKLSQYAGPEKAMTHSLNGCRMLGQPGNARAAKEQIFWIYCTLSILPIFVTKNLGCQGPIGWSDFEKKILRSLRLNCCRTQIPNFHVLMLPFLLLQGLRKCSHFSRLPMRKLKRNEKNIFSFAQMLNLFAHFCRGKRYWTNLNMWGKHIISIVFT